MVADSRRSVALLAVQPKYAAQLMDGTKRVEFRKTKFKKDVGTVYVYASSPIKQVVGYFEVKELVEDTPDGLWDQFNAVGGIEEVAYRAYYGNAEQGVAIVVGQVQKFSDPMDLNEFTGNSTPPQSFIYLDSETLAHPVKQPALDLYE